MTMVQAAEWSRSSAGRGAPGVDPAWTEMTTVWHNTHLVPALRIAEDRRISGGLVEDGKLRETRTEVVYVTPKWWGDGSIYGSFCFEMPWADLAKGRRLYWVEENQDVQNPISRLLLSWNDASRLPVTPYDPERHDGPLRLVGGKWFWLSTIVPEIVVDDPLFTISMTQLTFDRHRDGYCHPRRWSCNERGVGGSTDAQASFLARMLADPAIGMEDLVVRDGGLTHGVLGPLISLDRRLFLKQAWGGPIVDDVLATDAITAACLAYHHGERERARRLMGLIDTEARAERVFLEVIRRRFGLPGFVWPS